MLFEEVTRIEVSPERIFAFFDNMEANYQRWHPDHIVYRWLSGGAVREGATAYFEEYILGELYKKEVVFTRVEPNRHLEFAPTSRLFRLFLPRLLFRIEPAGDACVVTAQIHLRTGPIGAWLRRREFAAVRKHMREEGENLKRLMEQETAGPK